MAVTETVQVKGYISGCGNHALLDCAYLTRRNSQTSQTGPGERTRMYAMQTSRAVEDPGIHAEIRRCISAQPFHQIVQQPLTHVLRAQDVMTVACSD